MDLGPAQSASGARNPLVSQLGSRSARPLPSTYWGVSTHVASSTSPDLRTFSSVVTSLFFASGPYTTNTVTKPINTAPTRPMTPA